MTLADDSDLIKAFKEVVKGHTDIGFYVTLASVSLLNVVDDGNVINDGNVEKDQTREKDNVNSQEGLGEKQGQGRGQTEKGGIEVKKKVGRGREMKK